VNLQKMLSREAHSHTLVTVSHLEKTTVLDYDLFDIQLLRAAKGS
jgi:hypothetical protein